MSFVEVCLALNTSVTIMRFKISIYSTNSMFYFVVDFFGGGIVTNMVEIFCPIFL